VAFVDEASIEVEAGAGGNGSASFHHEPYKPKGGPDGGDGGDGGNVVLRAGDSVGTLLELQHHPHIKAGRGGHGAGKKRNGERGADRVVQVPPGTVVHQDDVIVADLAAVGDELVAARGGRGGRGNARFATPTRRAPGYAQKGEPGERRRLRLELRLLADVGLVGFPNAGKSTLISRVSSARPRVASYPFTTTAPNLGVVDSDGENFVVADIPGLLPGAHLGKGLGHRFLRHVSRAAVLCYMVDLAATERDPLHDVSVLKGEVEAFDAELAKRPAVVVGAKLDAGAHVAGEFRSRWPAGLLVSAVTGEGIEALLRRLCEEVRRARKERPAPAGYVRYIVSEQPITVAREEQSWRVRGARPERAVAVSDLDDEDSVARLQRALISMGVERALERAGARAGDEVRIGAVSFDFEPERGDVTS
jgi:GTPase